MKPSMYICVLLSWEHDMCTTSELFFSGSLQSGILPTLEVLNFILLIFFKKNFHCVSLSLDPRKSVFSCFHPTIIFTFTDFFLQLFISARVLTEILKSCAP